MLQKGFITASGQRAENKTDPKVVQLSIGLLSSGAQRVRQTWVARTQALSTLPGLDPVSDNSAVEEPETDLFG